jgi:MFS family permease
MASRSKDEAASNTTLTTTSTDSTPNRDEKDTENAESESSDSEEDDGGKPPRLRRVGTMSKDYTDAEEQTVLRKFDRRLVLFIALLYMLSFLDRSNIGNARIAGLDTALSLTSSQYSWLLTAFYITYIAFEWMILLYSLIPPHIYISLCVLSWGLVASLQSITTSFTQLVTLRGLLGITEAAFGPGVPFYLSAFYRRDELAYRVGLQISAAPLATSFASSLAWVIVKLSQNGPIEPWRALFLVEGFPSILVAIVAWYIIPDSPDTARYLTPRERKVARLRVPRPQHQHTSSSSSSSSLKTQSTSGLNLHDLLTTLLDPKAYLTALMFFSVNVAFSSLPVFLPTVLNAMSFSPLASQALAAPPYLSAFAFVIFISRRSDSHPDSRAYFIIGVSLLSAASYAAIAVAGLAHESLGTAGTITVRYVGVFGAAMGFFSAVTLIITWTLNNQESETGKGVGMTILNVIGQCGPLVGVRLFPKEEGPYYVKGMAVCSGFMLGVAGLAGVLRVYLGRLNARGQKEVEYEMVGMKDETDTAVEAEDALMGGDGGRNRGQGKDVFRFML